VRPRRRGRRVGIGGHSYGAFMSANLLAHSSVFKAAVGRSGAYNRLFTPFGFQGEERTLWEAPEVPAPARAACAPFPPSRPRLAWQCMNLKHRIQSNNSSGVPRHVSVSGRTQDRGAFPSDTWLRGAFATPHPPEPAPRPYCTARALARVCCSLAGLCGDGKDSGRGSSQSPSSCGTSA
jgi:hypothetical protein